MKSTSNSGVALSYLGVAGWHFKTASSSLLIDPFFTRLSLWKVAFGIAIPDREAIRRYTPPADTILVSHPHYDHIMDVPAAAEFTGASILASPQGCDLLSILGVPAAKFNSISPGQSIDAGDFHVQVYETRHRNVFGSIPYCGPLKGNLKPPLRPGDYCMDMQFSFLISVNAIRVLVTSGINDEPAVPADVLLVGPDTTYDQLTQIVEGVMPRLILPNHWDDMFQGLDRPVRPMIVPPPELFSPLKRINLDQFQKNLIRIAPTAKVIIPEYFVPYPLDIERAPSS